MSSVKQNLPPVELHQIVRIPISSIAVPMSKLDEPTIAQLMVSISRVGLMHPVQVVHNPNSGPLKYVLIAGFNRFEAFARLGIEYIDARVLPRDDDELEMTHIEENLMRKDLSELEKAIHQARLKELYEKENRMARRGAAGAAARHGQPNRPLSFTQWQAQLRGEHAKKIERRLGLAKRLSADAVRVLLGTPIANNTSKLQKVAEQPSDSQVAIAKALVSGNVQIVSDKASPSREKPPTPQGSGPEETGKAPARSDTSYSLTVTFLGRKVNVKFRTDPVECDLKDIGPADRDPKDRGDEA